MRELIKAPWANQTVGPLTRVLAGAFVVCGLFAHGSAAYLTVKAGIPISPSPEDLGLLVGSVYMMVLFSSVALDGKAPSGWVPWRSRRCKVNCPMPTDGAPPPTS